MLKPDVAKERLKPWIFSAADDAPAKKETRFHASLGKLPAKLASIGYRLYQLDAKGNLPAATGTDVYGRSNVYETRQNLQKEAAADFEKLSSKERIKLLQIMFPRMAAEVERTWNSFQHAPYQVGWSAKAFRAPQHVELSLAAKLDWLTDMLRLAEVYREEVLEPVWLAAWAPHLKEDWRSWEVEIGVLLATTIDAGGKAGDEVFEILRQSLCNEHEIGSMGRHVLGGLLRSSREEGWELVEKLLLAAQRQEGLRQSILETVDRAHPVAFRRMLRIIQEHDLARFSAVARAINIWFGFAWDSASVKVLNEILDAAATMLEQPDARKQALAGSDPQAAFMALWAAAFEDGPASIPLAQRLLKHKSAEMRYVALTHLGHLALAQAQQVRWTASDDEDLRVAMRAVGLITTPGVDADDEGEDAGKPRDDSFERVERLLPRLPPKPLELKPLVWPWAREKISQEDLSPMLLATLGRRSPTRLIPYLPALDTWRRREVVELFVKQKKWDAAARETVIKLAGDASPDVRGAAFAGLQSIKPTEAEVERLLATLTRKAADLRSGVLGLVIGLGVERSLAAADVLLAAKDLNQRLAGLELLRQLQYHSQAAEEARRRAVAYRDTRPKLNKDEERQLTAILAEKTAASTLSLSNALGLMDPAQRTPVRAPRNLKTKIITPAAIACLKELDDLVHRHRETPIVVNERTQETELLGAVQWGIPCPDVAKKPESQAKRWPLREVWETWLKERAKKTRDADGLELLRLSLWIDYGLTSTFAQWQTWAQGQPHRKVLLAPLNAEPPINVRYQRIIDGLLQWLLFLHPPETFNIFLLDAVETLSANVPAQELQALIPVRPDEPPARSDDQPWYGVDWRQSIYPGRWLNSINHARRPLTPAEHERFWHLLHWLDQPVAGARRKRPDSSHLLNAYVAGFANLHDLADDLVGERAWESYSREEFTLLSRLTQRRLHRWDQWFLEQHPEVRELVDRARSIIFDSELARGEAPTTVTIAAHSLHSLTGIDSLMRVLQALGKEGFKLNTGWRSNTNWLRPQTLTHLAGITYPDSAETPEAFAKRAAAEVKAKSFPEERLIELAFLAPQWTKFVEAYFQWDGLAEGLYWFLAHMNFMWGRDIAQQAAESAGVTDEPESPVHNSDAADADADDDADDVDQPVLAKPEKLSPWERLVRERTALSDQERSDGAIDVMWFQRVYSALGPQKWKVLAQAAKFASNGAQAKKAQLLADVLLGQAKLADLIAGIEKKFLKENVRLLGLYPLPTGAKREPELARRFKILQDYHRYAKKLSGLTKPDALRALEIGLKNLASTAGYADALRLDWALGVSQWAELRQGAVSASKDGVTVTLSIDEQVQPSIVVARGDKELKSAPPAVRKDPAIADLFERRTELKRHASRQKQALEDAMCRGDLFSAVELQQLCQHALVAPFLERLILVGDGVLGYPDKNGKVLRNHAGKLEPIKKNEELRIAHPHDLLVTGEWSAWQKDCFQAERVQPFKQVFRELYTLTKQEKTTGDRSQRYAGQQVNPAQAFALWGQRGWNTGEGVFKVFHHQGLVANVSFNHGTYTPLEVEGLTLESIAFTERHEYRTLKLSDVPPHLFSEVMRDMDLVVSVAHRGGVDPEASASTVEMRSSLVRESCQLLGLKNVRMKASHVLIDGELSNYSIHLGSGSVQRMPGGSLCVVPVHAQHRGRLFLPFAADDPRTAEILSKVLLFARDHEIQDPGILEQLRM